MSSRIARLARRRPLRAVGGLGAALACGLALLGVAAGCGAETPGADAPSITVYAAASLTDVLPEIGAAWTEDGGAAVTFSFGATSQLVPQIVEGAPADVLVAADAAWMDRLEGEGKAEPGTRTILARNELVFVVPSDARTAPASATRLPGDLGKIALAGEGVPAGTYAKAALEGAGVWAAVVPHLVRGRDVRGTLRFVASGEADGGAVYRTDALADAKVRVAFAFPTGSHPAIVYPAAAIQGSARLARAKAFLVFCRGARAQALLRARGFLSPGS